MALTIFKKILTSVFWLIILNFVTLKTTLAQTQVKQVLPHSSYQCDGATSKIAPTFKGCVPAGSSLSKGNIFGQDLNFHISNQSNELTLLFQWKEKFPALAVIRVGEPKSGKWWIVFDVPEPIPYSPTLESASPHLKDWRVISAEDGTVFELTVDSNSVPVISQEGKAWQISFKHSVSFNLQDAVINYPAFQNDGLVVKLYSAGKEVRFIDPHTGFLCVVIPSYQIGYGKQECNSFPEFQLLSSQQGVGCQLFKDSIKVEKQSGSMIVSHGNGLAVMSSSLKKMSEEGSLIPSSLFASANDVNWKHRVEQINEALLDLPHTEHGPGELETAWLLLSHGRTLDAIGYLMHLANERPSIAHTPLFQVLQGVGYMLLNQLSKAEEHLQVAKEDLEVQVWLSLIKVLQTPDSYKMNPSLFIQFNRHCMTAKILLKSYPPSLRHQMVTLLLLGCIALDDNDTLKMLMHEEHRPPGNGEEIFDLAKANILISQNKLDVAFGIWEKLMKKSTSPLSKDIACYHDTIWRLKTHMITKEEALPKLVAIHARWRNDWLGHRVKNYLTHHKFNNF